MRVNTHKVIAVQALLLSDYEFIDLALLRLYDQQVTAEKAAKHSMYDNEVGFNASDSYYLSKAAAEIRANGVKAHIDRIKIGHMLTKYSKQIVLLLTPLEVDTWL
jgi:phosphoenolpyruvate-protein kinase (PTS system EI component)